MSKIHLIVLRNNCQAVAITVTLMTGKRLMFSVQTPFCNCSMLQLLIKMQPLRAYLFFTIIYMQVILNKVTPQMFRWKGMVAGIFTCSIRHEREIEDLIETEEDFLHNIWDV